MSASKQFSISVQVLFYQNLNTNGMGRTTAARMCVGVGVCVRVCVRACAYNGGAGVIVKTVGQLYHQSTFSECTNEQQMHV